MVCNSYLIVLVGEMKGNKMAGPGNTYSGYRIYDVV